MVQVTTCLMAEMTGIHVKTDVEPTNSFHAKGRLAKNIMVDKMIFFETMYKKSGMLIGTPKMRVHVVHLIPLENFF
jgi:hypothetical protein